jgi:SAM-dependent methyltransferase
MTVLPAIDASIYDYPKYYDLVYGSDWKAEFNFLCRLFEIHVDFDVKRLFEPACGTGRLMFRLAKAGFQVAGNDLNRKAIEFCNKRLSRHGFEPTARIGDMTCFEVEEPLDAAFNTINSFRHLNSSGLAKKHLECVARALQPGGIYVLGLHLSPAEGNETCDEESWSATRGHLTVNSSMWLVERNYPERYESFRMSFDVYTPTRQFQIQDEVCFRTYTLEQIQELIESVENLEIEYCYDFRYDVDCPIKLNSAVEDIVLILRRL